MLTDIFAKRYSKVVLFPKFTEAERRLIVQSFRIIKELTPCPTVARETPLEVRAYWTDLDSRLSTELGLLTLSPRWQKTFEWPPDMICQNWALSQPSEDYSDNHMKERLSLVELGLRKRAEKLEEANARLEQECAAYLRRLGGRAFAPGDPTASLRAENARINRKFSDAVAELNTRFREAGAQLHYHNGFIQKSDDELLISEVEEPFWTLVCHRKWANVDTDMKEAIDLRDCDGRDPAWYAARALESTIKIISSDKKWTRGTENGPAHFIDNLVSQKNGRFIDVWEADVLKDFFAKIRNPFGHGPGEGPMPNLTPQQTTWAIHTCMAWAASLITRSAT